MNVPAVQAVFGAVRKDPRDFGNIDEGDEDDDCLPMNLDKCLACMELLY